MKNFIGLQLPHLCPNSEKSNVVVAVGEWSRLSWLGAGPFGGGKEKDKSLSEKKGSTGTDELLIDTWVITAGQCTVQLSMAEAVKRRGGYVSLFFLAI